MITEAIFRMLKKLQNQEEEDDLKIINGEFYYKGQVMYKEARKLFYEMKAEEEKRKLERKIRRMDLRKSSKGKTSYFYSS